MRKNTASQQLIVYVWDTTTGLPQTGDAANLTAYQSLDYGSVTAITDTSAAELSATNAKGYYAFDLSAGETNGDEALFTCKSATANMACRCCPEVVYFEPTGGIASPTAVASAVQSAVSADTPGRIGGHAVEVTKSDSTTYDRNTIGLYVGGTGDVTLTINGSDVLFSAVPAGVTLWVHFTRVMSTGTTATLMTAIYS